jgi:hypothetical protein
MLATSRAPVTGSGSSIYTWLYGMDDKNDLGSSTREFHMLQDLRVKGLKSKVPRRYGEVSIVAASNHCLSTIRTNEAQPPFLR